MGEDLTVRFILRGVSPQDVARDYRNGKYLDVVVPVDKVKSASWKAPTVITLRAPSRNKSFINKSGSVREAILASTDTGKSVPCLWCRSSFDHPYIGIPLSVVKIRNSLEILVEGKYCSYQCCYSDLREKIKSGLALSDHIYCNSEQFLNMMFRRQYPRKRLYPAPDWKLHYNNGGALSERDFLSEQFIFIDTGNIRMVNSTKEFMMMKT